MGQLSIPFDLKFEQIILTSQCTSFRVCLAAPGVLQEESITLHAWLWEVRLLSIPFIYEIIRHGDQIVENSYQLMRNGDQLIRNCDNQ
jgi:hypothetical protein